jgi:hypothetical protein
MPLFAISFALFPANQSHGIDVVIETNDRLTDLARNYGNVMAARRGAGEFPSINTEVETQRMGALNAAGL